MNAVFSLLAVTSLGAFLLTFFCWQLTSSRPAVISLLISGVLLFFAAYLVFRGDNTGIASILSFFSSMVSGGRALGYLLRHRQEPQLFIPGMLLAAIGLASLAGAALTFTQR
jgi:uncharacterized membrane protein (UPF0136 family)